MSINLKLIKRGDVTAKPIYQYRVDLCEFLRNKRRNPVAEIFYNMFGFTKYSNMNHSCPYDHDLILDRCRLDTKLLNLLSMAQGEYTITTICEK
ncbi:hypothetical protein CVS40_9454 [Lucilia cuprina]|nr:hypothetical protein CVS40_9454 [Lucilia cuprina]